MCVTDSRMRHGAARLLPSGHDFPNLFRRSLEDQADGAQRHALAVQLARMQNLMPVELGGCPERAAIPVRAIGRWPRNPSVVGAEVSQQLHHLLPRLEECFAVLRADDGDRYRELAQVA